MSGQMLDDRHLLVSTYGFDASHDVAGIVALVPNGDGVDIRIHNTPQIAHDPERLAGFCEWARERIRRFTEHGPEPDGWGVRSDGGYQLICREVPIDPAILEGD